MGSNEIVKFAIFRTNRTPSTSQTRAGSAGGTRERELVKLLISKAYFPAKKMNRMQNVKERWPKISTSNQISFCGLE